MTTVENWGEMEREIQGVLNAGVIYPDNSGNVCFGQGECAPLPARNVADTWGCAFEIQLNFSERTAQLYVRKNGDSYGDKTIPLTWSEAIVLVYGAVRKRALVSIQRKMEWEEEQRKAALLESAYLKMVGPPPQPPNVFDLLLAEGE
jgi:hypothetical protein